MLVPVHPQWQCTLTTTLLFSWPRSSTTTISWCVGLCWYMALTLRSSGELPMWWLSRYPVGDMVNSFNTFLDTSYGCGWNGDSLTLQTMPLWHKLNQALTLGSLLVCMSKLWVPHIQTVAPCHVSRVVVFCSTLSILCSTRFCPSPFSSRWLTSAVSTWLLVCVLLTQVAVYRDR